MTVFFDVDTQIDFLYPYGALYVLGGEKIIPVLRNLTFFAVNHAILIISTVDAHTKDDPEFEIWKPHCIVDSLGQQKVSATKWPRRSILDCSLNSEAPQIIVEKQTVDAFSNPYLKPLLDKMGADHYIVYGVVTEICVRHVANGLLNTGARVEIVTDAVLSLNQGEAEAFLDQFQSRGGRLIRSWEIFRENRA